MGSVLGFMFFLFSTLFLTHSSSHSQCTDSRGPIKPEKPLEFCPYNGSACCDSAKDLQLQKQFQALNISNPECASIIKSILCLICNQFSAELFNTSSGPGNVPVLCNSRFSPKSNQSNGGNSIDFCTRVWNNCGTISIWNSLFAQSLQDSGGRNLSSSPSKLTNQWKSRTSFCEAFGGTSDEASVCFNGEPVSFNSEEAPQLLEGLCLEKIGNGAYINFVPHPDGSNRVFLSNQEGKIWLVDVPGVGSNDVLKIVESKPFLDVTNEVLLDTELGLMGMAFHPNFEHNGRFFLSFNCDKMKQSGCFGRCSSNTDVKCDPAKLVADNGIQPCQYHNVIAEYTANGMAPKPSMEKRANPLEVRRILTMGLPTRFHAGQVFFGPADGFLYFAMGDGSNKDDPYNFAQNKKSLLGKILRLDIDSMPSPQEINNLGLWGNYSIPVDNPYVEDKELAPEIWALGFRNPWRCSFDSERPSYFFCGDTGQDQYEEVDIVTKGGNYGWRVYEGPVPFHPATTPGGSTSPSSINPIFPVMGYFHSEIDKNVGSASITGGYFYRSLTDPCMYGRYIYMDLYGGALWAGSEYPVNSGNFTSARIPFRCANDSPIACTIVEGSSLPSLGYIISFAEDNNKDLYILTSTGIYRVARPSRCKFSCSKENEANSTTSRHHSSSSSISTKVAGDFRSISSLLFFVFFHILKI